MTAREFILSYFEEREAVTDGWQSRVEPHYKKFFLDPDYLRFDRDEAQDILRTERFGESVAVITKERYGTHSKRYRYHLVPNGDSWLISSMESACWLCNKSGAKPVSACQACGGSAWIPCRKSTNNAGDAEGLLQSRN